MIESSLLSPDDIEELSDNHFENLSKLIALCSTENTSVRIAALKKLADDFPTAKFVPEHYPLKEIIRVFCNSVDSDDNEEVVEAIAGLTEIDASVARQVCIDNLDHSNIEVREEAICCLGYVGVERDNLVLTNILENETIDLLCIAAFNSLLRLGSSELLTLGLINFSQLSDKAWVSFIENLCTLTSRYDLQSVYAQIEKQVCSLNSEEVRREFFDFEQSIRKEKYLKRISALTSEEEPDWLEVVGLMEDPDSDIRFSAINLLGAGSKPNKKPLPSSRPPQFVFDKVKKLMEDEDEQVRAEAICVLGDWKDFTCLGQIGNCLFDESELVRLDAIYTLGEIRGKEALKHLELFDFNKSSEIERTRYYQAMIRLGCYKYFDKWLKYLRSADALVRANVAGGVWSVWSPSFHDKLKSAIDTARNRETFQYVLDEINDALEFLISKESI